MVETMRRGRRRAAGRKAAGRAAAAVSYAAMGWPVCAGAYPPPARTHRGAGAARGCSCDRIGCPAPGAHPISAAWQVEATTDPAVADAMWAARPDANVILATGRVFDVLDVPAPLGLTDLNAIDEIESPPAKEFEQIEERVDRFSMSLERLARGEDIVEAEPVQVPALTVG